MLETCNHGRELRQRAAGHKSAALLTMPTVQHVYKNHDTSIATQAKFGNA